MDGLDGLAPLDGRLLVVFDGQCGLCNRSMRWLMRRDARDRLRFAPSSAAELAGLLARHGVGVAGATTGSVPEATTESGPDTILVFGEVGGAGEYLLVQSDAFLACLRELPRPWPQVAAAVSSIPRFLRDVGYRLVARVRYRVWGRYASCPIPTPEERKHFL